MHNTLGSFYVNSTSGSQVTTSDFPNFGTCVNQCQMR